ncbi:MAG TPA: hypothetical protein VHT21_22930 [Stellaceae bacterium]|jgi:hypothetical protein|nr:hypothetical protein [Stellaceae bacterium]
MVIETIFFNGVDNSVSVESALNFEPCQYGPKFLCHRDFSEKEGITIGGVDILGNSPISLLFQSLNAESGWDQSWTPIRTLARQAN